MTCKIAYEGTRNICSRVSVKILNAVDEYWRDNVVNNVLRIVDDESADHIEFLALRMQQVAEFAKIWDDDWEAVNLAVQINNELQCSRGQK